MKSEINAFESFAYISFVFNVFGLGATILALFAAFPGTRFRSRHNYMLPWAFWCVVMVFYYIALLIWWFAVINHLELGYVKVRLFADILFHIWTAFVAISYYQWLRESPDDSTDIEDADSERQHGTSLYIPYNPLK